MSGEIHKHSIGSERHCITDMAHLFYEGSLGNGGCLLSLSIVLGVQVIQGWPAGQCLLRLSLQASTGQS